CVLSKREVDHSVGLEACAAVVYATTAHCDIHCEMSGVRGVGNIFHNTTQRVGAIQGALWAAEHFNPLHVESIYVWGKDARFDPVADLGVRCLVDVRGNGPVHLSGPDCYASYDELALAAVGATKHGKTRNLIQEVLQVEGLLVNELPAGN